MVELFLSARSAAKREKERDHAYSSMHAFVKSGKRLGEFQRV